MNTICNRIGLNKICNEIFIQRVLATTIILVALSSTSLFIDSYTKVKWIVVGASASLLALSLLFNKNGIPSRWHFPMGLVVIYLTRLALNANSFPLEQMMIVLAMTIIAYSTRTGLIRHLKEPYEIIIANLIALGTVTSIGYLQYFGFNPLLEGIENRDFPSSTFGFQNMTSEFIGFSILLALIYSKTSNTLLKIISIGCILLALPYLYILKSRTILLAFATSITLILPFLFGYFRRILIFLGITGVIICASVHFIFKIQSDPQISRVKKANIDIRLTRWRNTIEMIRSNPLGVGFGNFPYSYLDYNSKIGIDPESSEDQIVRSPHNAFLGLAAEAGMGVLVITLAFIFLTFIYSFKLLFSHQIENERKKRLLIYIAGSTYYLIDGIFNFPLELAYPCYSIAVVAGFGWSVFDFKNLNQKITGILFFTFCIIFYLTLAYAYSEFVYANQMDDSESVSRACSLFPGNYFVCARKAEIELFSEEYDKAIQTTSDLLKRQPNFFPARRIRGDAYLRLNHQALACDDYRAYNGFFTQGTSMAPTINEICSTP